MRLVYTMLLPRLRRAGQKEGVGRRGQKVVQPSPSPVSSQSVHSPHVHWAAAAAVIFLAFFFCACLSDLRMGLRLACCAK